MKTKLSILFLLIFTFLTMELSAKDVIKNKNAKVENIQILMEVYEIKNTYSDSENVKVTIYYYPLTKQARIIYDIDYELFDYSDAIVSLKRCLEDFTKKIGCYHYKRYRPDEERYFKLNDKKYTRIISFVNFYE